MMMHARRGDGRVTFRPKLQALDCRPSSESSQIIFLQIIMQSTIIFILLLALLSGSLALSDNQLLKDQALSNELKNENFIRRNLRGFIPINYEEIGSPETKPSYVRKLQEMNFVDFIDRPIELFNKPINDWDTRDWITMMLLLVIASCMFRCLSSIACCGCSIMDCLMCYCCLRLCCDTEAGIRSGEYVGM
jgi:hypothetical protein